jgi:hypothetical protein
MNVPFVVTDTGTPPAVVACRCPHAVGSPIEWYPLRTAWRALDHVLTWDTEDGAQRFADMNGGNVTPLSEVFSGPGILQPHGPLQHSPDEAGPLERGSGSQTQE